MDIISSPKNEKIKELVKLQTAKGRKKAGMYLLEGEHLVEEAIKERAQIKLIVVTSNRLEDYKNLLAQTDVQVLVVSQDVFHKLSMTETTQGILAVVEIVKQEILPHKGHLIVLDAVQDPGNLGTIIRLCDATNFKDIILTKGTVDAYNEKVIRATMGSILNVNLFYLEKQEIIKILKENNYSVIATYLDKEALPYNKIKLKEKNAVIFGNEGRGICDEFVSISDYKTIIPILSNTESLNVAVASAIILYKFREIEGLI